MNADQSNNQTVRRDKFCWICHKKYLKISCAKCFRIFHDKCLKSADNYRWGNKSETKLASCTVCTVEETSKKACDNKAGLLKLLKYIMIDILDNPDFRVFKDLSALKKEAKYCDDVVNPIDLNEIDRKICRELYDSFYAFLVDIDCIYHNCFVYYGERHEHTKIAESLTLKTEAISSCVECYENKHLHPTEWRTLTCSKPHLVLWARLSQSLNFWPVKKGFTHWPAKLLSIDDDVPKVIFFESSEFVDISAKDCWIYSTKCSKLVNQRFFNQNYIHAALKEVDLYAKNVEKKFGRFQNELACIPFDQNHHDAHMAAMFPDYERCLVLTVKEMPSTEPQPIDNDEVDERPTKRPRLSIDAAEAPNHDSTKAIAIIRDQMQIIEHEMTEINSIKDKAQQKLMNELNSAKKALADAQDDNRKLMDDLRSVSLERDKTQEAMTRAKDMHTNEVATLNQTYQNKISEAKDEIKRVRTMEQMKAKAAVKDAISEQLKKMSKIEKENQRYSGKIQEIETKIQQIVENLLIKTSELKNTNDALIKAKEELTEAKADIERIRKEKITAEEDLEKVTKKHDTEMETLRKQLQASHFKVLDKLQTKLEKEHNEVLDTLRQQHDNQLECEKNRVEVEIEKWKMDQRQKLADWKNKMHATVDERLPF